MTNLFFKWIISKFFFSWGISRSWNVSLGISCYSSNSFIKSFINIEPFNLDERLDERVRTIARDAQRYIPAPGDSPAKEEFRDNPFKKEICHRLLAPYQLIGHQNHGIYFRILEQIFDSGNNVPIFKAVAIADEIATLLRRVNSRALPDPIKYSSSDNTTQEPGLADKLNQIFERYLPIDNERFTERVLTQPTF